MRSDQPDIHSCRASGDNFQSKVMLMLVRVLASGLTCPWSLKKMEWIGMLWLWLSTSTYAHLSDILRFGSTVHALLQLLKWHDALMQGRPTKAGRHVSQRFALMVSEGNAPGPKVIVLKCVWGSAEFGSYTHPICDFSLADPGPPDGWQLLPIPGQAEGTSFVSIPLFAFFWVL